MRDIRDIGYLTRWQVWTLDIGYLIAIDPGHWTFDDLDLRGSDVV